VTMKIIKEKPRNKLLIEDIEWDEEDLKAHNTTKEEAFDLYKYFGLSYKDFKDMEL